MAIISVDMINNLFGVVLKNAEHIGDLVREMETIDQIWYMMVSFLCNNAFLSFYSNLNYDLINCFSMQFFNQISEYFEFKGNM